MELKYLQVGEPGPDRNAQFEFINDEARRFMESNLPVISIDAKKKELIGNYKNNGAEIRPVKEPRLVNDHDFGGEGNCSVPSMDFTIEEGDRGQMMVSALPSYARQRASKTPMPFFLPVLR